MKNNLDEDIKLAKEVAADLRTYVDEYKVRKGRAISSVVAWLENYREDYNHRCQLAIDRAKEIEKLKEINKNLVSCAQGQSEKILTLNTELEKYKRIANMKLDDREEIINNLCEHRCLVKSHYEEELETYKKIAEKMADYINELVPFSNPRSIPLMIIDDEYKTSYRTRENTIEVFEYLVRKEVEKDE